MTFDSLMQLRSDGLQEEMESVTETHNNDPLTYASGPLNSSIHELVVN